MQLRNQLPDIGLGKNLFFLVARLIFLLPLTFSASCGPGALLDIPAHLEMASYKCTSFVARIKLGWNETMVRASYFFTPGYL